jgi:hypothetical protein
VVVVVLLLLPGLTGTSRQQNCSVCSIRQSVIPKETRVDVMCRLSHRNAGNTDPAKALAKALASTGTTDQSHASLNIHLTASVPHLEHQQRAQGWQLALTAAEQYICQEQHNLRHINHACIELRSELQYKPQALCSVPVLLHGC